MNYYFEICVYQSYDFFLGRLNEEEEIFDFSVEKLIRFKFYLEILGVYGDLFYSLGVMDIQSFEFKVERIVRYKAERRRQLVEKYGLSLDFEVDFELIFRYIRFRKDFDVVDKRGGKSDRQVELSKELSFFYIRIEISGFRTGVVEFRDYVFFGSDGVSDIDVLFNVEN